jgi:hypothetical protein
MPETSSDIMMDVGTNDEYGNNDIKQWMTAVRNDGLVSRQILMDTIMSKTHYAISTS